MDLPRQSDNPKPPEPGAATAASLVRGGTGPRTKEGKSRTKYNAVKQGIFSKVAVLKSESKAEFDVLLNGLRDYFQPGGTFEEIWVEKLAMLMWRERRLIVADSQVDIRNRERLSVLTATGSLSDPIRSEPRRDSDLLLRYETTLNRNIDRTLNQLERHQRMRRGQPVPPPINVNVSCP